MKPRAWKAGYVPFRTVCMGVCFRSPLYVAFAQIMFCYLQTTHSLSLQIDYHINVKCDCVPVCLREGGDNERRSVSGCTTRHELSVTGAEKWKRDDEMNERQRERVRDWEGWRKQTRRWKRGCVTRGGHVLTHRLRYTSKACTHSSAGLHTHTHTHLPDSLNQRIIWNNIGWSQKVLREKEVKQQRVNASSIHSTPAFLSDWTQSEISEVKWKDSKSMDVKEREETWVRP